MTALMFSVFVILPLLSSGQDFSMNGNDTSDRSDAGPEVAHVVKSDIQGEDSNYENRKYAVIGITVLVIIALILLLASIAVVTFRKDHEPRSCSGHHGRGRHHRHHHNEDSSLALVNGRTSTW